MSDTVFGRLVWLVVAAATLNALIFLRVNPDRIVPGTDSPEYDLMARQIISDRGLTLQTAPPYDPTLYREPGYPLIVAAVYKLVGQNVDAVMVLQAVLLGLSAGLAAVIGARLVGPTLGLVGGALFGIDSEVAHYAHWLLTEIPFTFLVVLTLALALRALLGRSRLDFLLTGLALGLSVLVRAIGGALALPVLLVFALGRGRNRQTWSEVALFAVGTAVVVLPWVVRNSVEIGHPAITSRFGVNLVRRAPRAAEPLSAYPPQIVAALWMMANPISQFVWPISRFQWGSSYEDNLIWDFHVNEQVRYLERYQPVCEPLPDADACYGAIGLDFVRRYPVGYVLQTPFEIVKLLFAPLPGPQALIHNGLVWLGILGAVAMASSSRLRREHWLALGFLLSYIAACIPVDTQQRYLVPMLPIVAIFAVVPVWEFAVRLMYRVPLLRVAATQLRSTR